MPGRAVWTILILILHGQQGIALSGTREIYCMRLDLVSAIYPTLRGQAQNMHIHAKPITVKLSNAPCPRHMSHVARCSIVEGFRPGAAIDQYCAVIMMMLTTDMNDDFVSCGVLDNQFEHYHRHSIDSSVYYSDQASTTKPRSSLRSPLNSSDGMYCAVC